MNRSANIVSICCLVVISFGLMYWLHWQKEQKRLYAVSYKKYGLLDLRNIVSALQVEFKFRDSASIVWSSDVAENAHLSVIKFIEKNTEGISDSRDKLQDENGLDYLIKKKDHRFIVWGVGLNKIDEGGNGDDLCISFDLPEKSQ